MTFRFTNGSVVTISPVDATNLREAAWAAGRQNAVGVLEGGDLELGGIPASVGDEILASAEDADPQTEAIRRLRQELKLEYGLSFVYRGFVHEADGSEEQEFVATEEAPLHIDSTVEIDGRMAIVRTIEAGPRGFDGLLSCEWSNAASPAS